MPRPKDFSDTAAAAKLSGTFHKTAGFLKRKVGEMTNDANLEEAGREQQLVGKLHRFVGALRGAREDSFKKLNRTRIEILSICGKYSGQALDVASDFVDEIKTALLK